MLNSSYKHIATKMSKRIILFGTIFIMILYGNSAFGQTEQDTGVKDATLRIGAKVGMNSSAFTIDYENVTDTKKGLLVGGFASYKLLDFLTVQGELLYQQSLFEPRDNIVGLQADFLQRKSLDDRKALGQFFTGSVVSEYMASLISKSKWKNISILDAGAGTGILTASAALRCLDLGCTTVHAILYEVDCEALPNLEQTLMIVQKTFARQNRSFSFEIRCENFVLARPDKDPLSRDFDISVINPPYFKYSVTQSPYAKAAADLYHGDPNIYASFMAVVMACMKDGGQMITITPRSFTNGLYFRGCRSYLLTESALDLIHIFKHRNKMFRDKGGRTK